MTRRQNQTLAALLPAVALLLVGAWWTFTGDGSNRLRTDAELTSALSQATTSSITPTTATRTAGTFADPTNLDGAADPLVIALPNDDAADGESTSTSKAATTSTSTSSSPPSSSAPSSSTSESTTTASLDTTTTSAEPSSTSTSQPPSGQSTTSSSTTTSTTSTTEKPTPEPTQPPSGQCDVVILEAESLPTTGAWRVANGGRASGGKYITWEGLAPERNNSQPADVMSTSFTIGKTGEYRFTWAMRQPEGVANDKANDSWVNFPNADRFGPVGGGRYGGFVKVFGNSKGDFKYAGAADVNHQKTKMAIVFNNPGTYTLKVAGRSHGHQIDRIVIHHQSVSATDAIAGRGKTC